MALGLLVAVLVLKLTVLSVSGEQWRAVHYSQPQTLAVAIRLAVGLPEWVIGVLLLADRSGQRMGALLLAAGAVLVVPRTVSDLLAFIGDWSAPVDATVLALAAVALADHPLSVLVFPVCFLREPAVRRCRWYLIAPTTAVHAGHGALWFLAVPGAPPFFSPWSGTATAQWALQRLGPASRLVDWGERRGRARRDGHRGPLRTVRQRRGGAPSLAAARRLLRRLCVLAARRLVGGTLDHGRPCRRRHGLGRRHA
ncbi:hypothetical protein [Streptomyces sp. WAC 01529]|uniref:hypothetical protein n=1 Tax=Streptomyces sp. WAC 01529 TaxID=2203205 RepID=UPI0019CFFFE0|nr:hypothetical protein [Streptomyces sp. WAC 01529]